MFLWKHATEGWQIKGKQHNFLCSEMCQLFSRVHIQYKRSKFCVKRKSKLDSAFLYLKSKPINQIMIYYESNAVKISSKSRLFSNLDKIHVFSRIFCTHKNPDYLPCPAWPYGVSSPKRWHFSLTRFLQLIPIPLVSEPL